MVLGDVPEMSPIVSFFFLNWLSETRETKRIAAAEMVTSERPETMPSSKAGIIVTIVAVLICDIRIVRSKLEELLLLLLNQDGNSFEQ